MSMTSETGGRKRGTVRAAEFDVAEARKAFFLMVGFIAVIWVLQIFNWADHYRLDYDYGVLPRNIGRLPQIFSAPFLHFSWDHIEGNSGPLFVFGLPIVVPFAHRRLSVPLNWIAILAALVLVETFSYQPHWEYAQSAQHEIHVR